MSIFNFVTNFLKRISFVLIISHWNTLEGLTVQQDQGFFFQFINGHKLLLKPQLSSVTSMPIPSDRNGCVSYCLTDSSCNSANFRISTGECSLFGANSWENEFSIFSDIDNIIIQKVVAPLVIHGQWTLVFRGLANIGQSVYDAYTDTSLGHDQPLSPMYPIGCLRLDTNLTCDHHFRSNILNEWSNLTIREIKFGIYKDGVMQKFLLFNGSSSTFITWFTSASFMNSSWTDLSSSPIDYFSIRGCDSPGVQRRFYVEHSHIGCYSDSGWFGCIDQVGDTCAWGISVPTFPQFLYSQGTTRVANVNMMSADIIAIFIKF